MQIERRTVMLACENNAECGFIHFLARKVINRIFIGKDFANFAHYSYENTVKQSLFINHKIKKWDIINWIL